MIFRFYVPPPLFVKYLKLEVLTGSGEKALTADFSNISVFSYRKKKNTLPKRIYSDNGNPFIPMLFLFYPPPLVNNNPPKPLRCKNLVGNPNS